MPRGKVASERLNFKADADNAGAQEEEKNSNAKFTLIEPDAEEDNEDDSLVRSVQDDFADTIESSRPNFKFTLLLVTLFVAVNIGLIALLDNNKSGTAEQAEQKSKGVEVITDVSEHKPAVMQPVVKETMPEKPVLAGEAPAASTVAPEVVTPKPVPSARPAIAEEKPVVKKQPSSSASSQDLLSIIGKN